MNTILGDYLAGILGTFRENNEWYLNPLEEIREGGVTKVARAEGNCVSIEFNLLYRVRVGSASFACWILRAYRLLVSGMLPSPRKMNNGWKARSRRTFRLIIRCKRWKLGI